MDAAQGDPVLLWYPGLVRPLLARSGSSERRAQRVLLAVGPSAGYTNLQLNGDLLASTFPYPWFVRKGSLGGCSEELLQQWRFRLPERAIHPEKFELLHQVAGNARWVAVWPHLSGRRGHEFGQELLRHGVDYLKLERWYTPDDEEAREYTGHRVELSRSGEVLYQGNLRAVHDALEEHLPLALDGYVLLACLLAICTRGEICFDDLVLARELQRAMEDRTDWGPGVTGWPRGASHSQRCWPPASYFAWEWWLKEASVATAGTRPMAHALTEALAADGVLPAGPLAGKIEIVRSAGKTVHGFILPATAFAVMTGTPPVQPGSVSADILFTRHPWPKPPPRPIPWAKILWPWLPVVLIVLSVLIALHSPTCSPSNTCACTPRSPPADPTEDPWNTAAGSRLHRTPDPKCADSR